MRLGNKGKAEVMSLVVFAVLLLVLVNVYSSIDNSISIPSTSTEAVYARQNQTNNTWSAIQLAGVGPIIIGAVLILGILGLLYSRR